MTPELTAFAFAAAVFGAVFIVVLAVSSVMTRSVQVRRRLAQQPAGYGLVATPAADRLRGFLARNVDERIFRLDQTARGRLRRELVRAGYFSAEAVPLYLTIRALVLIALPLAAYVTSVVLAPGAPEPLRIAFVAAIALLAFFLPKAFISRRERTTQRRYREGFPDMMDLLLVCVDAGLGLDSALERVALEMADTHRELGINLSLVGMEVRAGRGTMDALNSFADRAGIDEATSFATLLRQSSELGTSISQALRVYSDEMRDRRLSRAEERAGALPVKLVIPLGLSIFPVILAVVMLPLVLRLITLFVR